MAMAKRGWQLRLGRVVRAVVCGAACLVIDAAFAQAPVARPSFDIEVRSGNRDVRELLQRHLELQRFREVPDLDDAELQRLLRLADRDARQLLGTLGFFTPRLDIHREPAPEGGVPQVVVDVDPGEATTVAGVDIAFEGDIRQTDAPDAAAQRAKIRDRWSLPAGRPFTQDGWNNAKTQALRDLVTHRYPAGKVSYSIADVDAATHRAQLGLRLDSGPVFRLGAMQVNGVERYEPVLVPRLAQLPVGSVYDQDQIQRAQLRLVGSGYFDSAFIYVDPSGTPDPAPVQVNVREARLHKVVLGLGFSTDSGPRATVDYTQNRLPGIGWRAITRLQVERKNPFIETELQANPGEDLWRWGTSLRIERLDDGQLITHGQRLRVGRTRADEHIDRNIYVQFDRATVQVHDPTITPEDTGDGTALSLNYIWNGRYFDATPSPTAGYSLGAEFGGGVTLVGSKSFFQRTLVRTLQILPFEESRLQWRAEGGAVLAASRARVPSTQLFRTGGDTTVRGYGLREIGVERAGGVVGPGRYLMDGSVEWQRPIRRNGVVTPFETATFIDAGAVTDTLTRLRFSYGVGAGVRYRSPLGPLQVDLAYGVQVHRFRLHVNLISTF
ncbi:autotransporter assembly complex protein TamA [Ramlibacter sp. MMS24-I3-19]|uniref:autotransporter assembly complex protein TamA n=1 Tax=Ramlibacter sp. MMS24-I3-19 TaxID=3416606 RepID=UPI003D07A70C